MCRATRARAPVFHYSNSVHRGGQSQLNWFCSVFFVVVCLELFTRQKGAGAKRVCGGPTPGEIAIGVDPDHRHLFHGGRLDRDGTTIHPRKASPDCSMYLPYRTFHVPFCNPFPPATCRIIALPTSVSMTKGRKVIAELLGKYGMDQASNVILTGGSSGGLATYLTCDRVGDQIAAANPKARYTCLADAGFFLHHNDIGGGNETAERFKSSYYAWNATGGTNQACVAARKPTGDDWRCIFAEYASPYIRSELFVMQNLYDSWQVRVQNLCFFMSRS